jgi:microtubule-associated protein-like 6
LWQVFNDIADGFGIGVDELIEICADLKDEINVSRLSIIEKSTLLFELLDTDKNGLIDALEFMSTIAALSGMRLLETIEFVLSSYDFDSTGELSVDEVTLALKSVSTGLCKLCLVKMPREETIEQLVSTMFSEMAGSEASDMMKVRINVIVEKLLAHPDVRSWYAFFGNTPQADLQPYDLTIVDKDFDRENQITVRSTNELKGYDWNLRSVAQPGDQVTNQPDALWVASVSMLVPLAYSNQTMSKQAPDASLTPLWVYGYQAEQCRNNLRYNYQGDVVYNTGKHVIVYNFNSHKQNIFSTHVDEIVALVMHPDGQYCATGENGNRPRVIVWHTVTREVVFMYVFCYTIVLPFFLVCGSLCLSLSSSIAACLHSPTPHDTSLTINPLLLQSSIDSIITLLITIQVQRLPQGRHRVARFQQRRQAALHCGQRPHAPPERTPLGGQRDLIHCGRGRGPGHGHVLLAGRVGGRGG